MISSAFTPPHLRPAWLGALAMSNPVSSTATVGARAVRQPGRDRRSWIEQHAVLMAVAWPALITVVLVALAVRGHQAPGR